MIYCSPTLGRFTQPDTIVPNPGNPQSLNRYSYVGNNPVRYVDPSGHYICESADGVCKANAAYEKTTRVSLYVKQKYNISIASEFELEEVLAIQSAIRDFDNVAGGPAPVRLALGGVSIHKMPSIGVFVGGNTYQTVYYQGSIHFDTAHFNQTGLRQGIGTRIGTVHELAHYWSEHMRIPWGFPENGIEIETVYSYMVGNEVAPTLYGTTSVAERWAESVAMYVYPEYENILRDENMPGEVNRDNRRGPGLRPRHRSSVGFFFGVLQVAAQ